jgi:hypothetical protein
VQPSAETVAVVLGRLSELRSGSNLVCIEGLGGAGKSTLELRVYWDFAIYVDAPRDLRQARPHARGENDDGWISRWAAAEDFYERAEQPAQAADLVVNGH